MAKFPKLYGNTYTAYDIHNSSGVNLSEADGIFDVYKYQNAGQNDNTERAHGVFILKNEAVEGTTTGLCIYSISLRDHSDTSVVYSGDNLSLNAKVNDIPFIGSQDNFENNTGNKVAAKLSGNPPGADTVAGLEKGIIKFASAVTTIDSSDLNPDLTSGFRAIPIHHTTEILHGLGETYVIPSNSYAAFVVTFHPTVDIADNSVEAVLKIETNVGIYDIDLSVNSFNEIIMIAKPATQNYDGSDELIVGSTIIYDEGTISLGFHPRQKTVSLLEKNFIYQGLEISDISPNASNASYKFTNSSSSNGVLNSDSGTLPLITGHSGGNIDHFDNNAGSGIREYYINETYYPSIALFGTLSTADYFQEAGNFNLYQRFNIMDASTPINDGTRSTSNAATQKGINYSDTTTDGFAKQLQFRVNYVSTQYNNTNAYHADFPDDGFGTGNELFNYKLGYGVYEKVTVPAASLSGTIKNTISPGQSTVAGGAASFDVDAASVANGNIPQTGSTWNYSNVVRWNNYRGVSDTTKYTLASFEMSTNTEHFKMMGTKTANCVPSSYNLGAGDVTAGTFSHFNFDDTNFKEATVKHPFVFTLQPDELYPNLVTELGSTVGSTYLMNPTENNAPGLMEATLLPYHKDRVWNFNNGDDTHTPEYPGIHHDAQLNFKAYFYPRDSYLKVGIIGGSMFNKDADGALTPGYPNGTGLPTNIQGSTNFSDVTNWFDHSGTQVTNTTAGLASLTYKNYSGSNGAIYNGSSWQVTTTTASGDKTITPKKRLVRDKNSSEINDFIPVNKILSFPAPVKHTSSDKYTTFQTFMPFNEGDYNIYIHSIEGNQSSYANRVNQLLDFDVDSAGNNIAGTSVFGYKPGHNGTDAGDTHANSSSSPVLSWHIEHADEASTWNSSQKIYTTNADYNPSKAADWYRGGGKTSVFYPPKFLQGFDNSDDVVTNNLNVVAETGEEIAMNCSYIQPMRSPSDQIYLENPTGSETQNAPQGNLLLHLRMEVAAKGSTIDFGTYYETLTIKYYKDNYANRKYITGTDSFADTDNSKWVIHEMKIICKTIVEPTPILVIADNEGEEFTAAQEVFLGNVNIG